MKPTATIRLLTPSKNEKGDLFTRLISDLFHGLGYDEISRDLSKPGREIDIQSEHRHESRQAAVECKAHQGRMGGDAINKFRGAVEVERDETGKKITGYFVSLGGFTGAAIEQEKRKRKNKLVLLDSSDVIKELEKSKTILSDAEATGRAGQCVNHAGLSSAVIDEVELLAHESGYIKAVVYTQNGARTHFALIHADGVALADVPAQVIIAADQASGGFLHTLKYLPPVPIALDRQQIQQRAKEHYQRWVNAECGFIQLDGMPTEADYSTKSLKLERLFVPLKVIITKENAQVGVQSYSPSGYESGPANEKSYSVSELLTDNARIALLAAPGGGKSTLLKRLATAYISEERRKEIADNLPAHDWLPLFLRCRELRNRATNSILSILEDIPVQTGMATEDAEAFKVVTQEALRAGRVLLLVDGLDEIPDEADRKIFAKNLRTFLAVYPLIAMVVTSREAGFRAVAGVIADTCQHARLALLEAGDVASICMKWHLEVAGMDSPEIRFQAEKLTQDIFSNPSIYTLARNPLLLTTLLVVKRSIGELPRNRAGLYAEAVRLLVKTWNVEGFGYNLVNLTENQALAQLCYVACAMLEQGIKQIPQSHLYTLLYKAKEVLAEELHYTNVSPEEFIQQVESRSSLLIRTGIAKVDGVLEPIYEFRHLTFQEYLAARGYVKEQHARRPEDLRLVDVLSPHFLDENWYEVIPLAAALAEHKADGIVRKLIAACDEWRVSKKLVTRDSTDPHYLLAQCLVDEVSILPATMTAALARVALYAEDLSDSFTSILNGRAGNELLAIVEEKFLADNDEWENYTGAVEEITTYKLFQKYSTPDEAILDSVFIESLVVDAGSSDAKRCVYATIMVAAISRLLYGEKSEGKSTLEKQQAKKLREAFDLMLSSGNAQSIHAASYALAWTGADVRMLGVMPPDAQQLLTLFNSWKSCTNSTTASTMAWAFIEQPLLDRNALTEIGVLAEPISEFLKAKHKLMEPNRHNNQVQAALLMGWYLKAPWSDAELVKQINAAHPQQMEKGYYSSIDEEYFQRAKGLLNALGKAGKSMQEKRERNKKIWLNNIDKQHDDLPF